MTACEESIARLAEAQAAMHALLTGRRVVELRHADKTLRYYDAGNIADLRMWIRDLQQQVDTCNGVRPATRVLHFIPCG